MDQAGDIFHQRAQFQRGTDAFAHLGDECQLVGAALQVAIEPGAFHRPGDRIRKRLQDEQIIGMEGMRLIALDIKHAQNAVLHLQSE